MTSKLTNRIVAGAVFAFALVLYLLTVAPTVSFWDAGEFILTANKLEVNHPPGAPFYMLLGRFFSMFVPTEWVAYSINLISVLASTLTVLLTHLIIVRLARKWQGEERTTSDKITAQVGGVVGACTFAATDSFWFNAVEAEVYALSMFFTASVVWLILRWSEVAREEERLLAGGNHPFGLRANRYLVLIAYAFGLALGVHMLNLLAVFFCALIVFFTEFERPEWTRRKRIWGLVAAGAASVGAFLLIYPGVVLWLPTFAGQSGMPVAFLVFVVLAVTFSVYYTHSREMQLANLVMVCITVVLIGYSAYALIFIRSAADPPIDENDPETAESIVSYLKREQYGSTPLIKGSTYDNAIGRIGKQDEWFPRRWSPQPRHTRVYQKYDSDWEFFWKYQVGHMYLRYFMWNFSGRASDVQDAPAITGFSFIDKAIAPANEKLTSPSEEASRNAYFLLPLLLGLIGAAFHFSADWRRALSVGVLFLVTGIGIIVYLNQKPMQPRERDYSYVASFFAFSLWVGIGASGLLRMAAEALREGRDRLARKQHAVMLGLGALLFAAVPGWMTAENYYDHDRSGRYVAEDYAHNILTSLEKNAIVFTNGDNDTFPLWYLQEVEGVRPDVRVVNLSLLNTSWYIKQLKNQQARKSEPLPISYSEKRIENIRPQPWKPRTVKLPASREQIYGAPSETGLSVGDTSQIESPMTWKLEGRPYRKDTKLLHVADQVVYNVLGNVAQDGWKRPVYFALTVSRDGQLNLQNHFQLEGQAFRIVPVEHNESMGRVVPEITPKRLEDFRFSNLDDPDVYYNNNIRRMVDAYRNIYARTARGLADKGHAERGAALLDTLATNVPFETIPGGVRSHLMMARAYKATGHPDRMVKIMEKAEPLVLQRMASARSQRDRRHARRLVQMVRFMYLRAGNYEAASAFGSRLAKATGNKRFQMSPDELRKQFQGMLQSSPTDSASDGGTPGGSGSG
jgi:hypothetical protein